MDKKVLMKYISSFVMGDGCVTYPTKCVNCILKVGHVEANRDYLEWKADILSNLTKVRIDEKPPRGNRQPFLEACTRTHPTYTKIRDRMYFGDYKSVDPHYLKLMDWETMAILFQDDGHARKRDEKRQPEITLGLCRLSYGDYLLLKRAIEERIGIYSNIIKSGKALVLRIRNKDGAKFMDNIETYMKPSMMYKWICPDEWPRKGDDIVRTA